MKAMLLEAPGSPLVAAELGRPEPGPGQVLLRVRACGVCRTDLHVVDGELTHPKLPLVPGHQIVGETEDGRRLGVPWLGWTCGTCRFCTSGRENLCDRARFTGYDLDGGYAEWAVADERFCFPLPDGFGDLEVAPLLCAGLIGYRSLRMAGDAARLGLYGFGAAAHIIAQVARFEGRRVFAVTRPGDDEAQSFARSLGAEWAGLGRAARGARRRDHLRPRRRARARRAPRRREGRRRRLRRHPHVGHPVLPLRDPLGRALAPLGREPDAATAPRSSSRSHHASRCEPRSRCSRSPRPTRPWRNSAAAASAARSSSCPELDAPERLLRRCRRLEIGRVAARAGEPVQPGAGQERRLAGRGPLG